MNIREQLKNPASIGYIDLIIENSLLNDEGFEELFSLIFDNDKGVAWRAGWACDKICRKFPELFNQPKQQKIIDKIPSENHNGLLRAYLSIINNLECVDNLPVEVINRLFKLMTSVRADVSHQVLSMKILCKLCEREPAFIPELLAYLENIEPSDFKPGFKTTINKMIKQLKNREMKISKTTFL